mgnify:CR=1 FL=1|jgi:hypothetical protein
MDGQMRQLVGLLLFMIAGTAHAWECPEGWEYNTWLTKKIQELSNGGPCTPAPPRPVFKQPGSVYEAGRDARGCERNSATQAEYDQCMRKMQIDLYCGKHTDRRAYQDCVNSIR